MKPDVLFWFYKDFETCRERLQRLRKRNEGVRVFALYGGPLLEAEIAQNVLHKWVDDFYVYPQEKNSYWKWKHGDQMITTWYMERGQYLKWETIFIVQWDMLILDSLEKLFLGLQPHEILLSGFRPISTVSSWWPWANPTNSDLLSFKELLRNKFNYEGELFVCLFIVICLPRVFLEKYVAAGHPEIGFLEYKIPTMAHVFGVPVCNKHNFEPWWRANPATKNVPRRQRILNAVGEEVSLLVILQELMNSDGKRLFHPVSNILPSWMENQYMIKILSYTYFLQIIEISIKITKKLKQYANYLTNKGGS
jgi:hypothetical protein